MTKTKQFQIPTKIIKFIFFSLLIQILFFIKVSLSSTNTENTNTYKDINSAKKNYQKESTEIKKDETFFDENLPSALISLGRGHYFSSYVILVEKLKRELSIWKRIDNKIKHLGTFAADIGKNIEDKNVLGDKATPEGIYFFQEKYENPNLNFEKYGIRAFTTDYPNFFDRKEQKSGSGIWLHAIPDTIPLDRGSRGCVVVRNNIIEKITNFITLIQTPIIIFDQISFIKNKDLEKSQNIFKNLIENWRTAWEKKEIESYINFYSSDFKGYNMNKNQWKKYKERLNNLYDYFSVSLSEPIILKHKEEVIIKFLQSYDSEKYNDFGEKTLYLKKHQDRFQIIGEKFKAIKNTFPQGNNLKKLVKFQNPQNKKTASSTN